MGSAAEILVVVLTGIIAICLVLGIILAVLLVRVSRQIRRVSESARQTADTIESTVVGVSGFSSPLLLTSALVKKIRARIARKKRKGTQHE